MPNSRFALHGFCALLENVCLQFTVYAPLRAAPDTCLDSSLLCQPLSAQFALHGNCPEKFVIVIVLVISEEK